MDKPTRAALGEVAAHQRGLFSVAQAKQIGVTNAQLLRAEAAGQFRRVRRGVYAPTGAPPSRWDDIVSAVLVAGNGAVVSHASAAAVHRFEYGGTGVVELTVGRGSYVRPPGVVVHRVSDLAPEDIVRGRGVAVTSPSRTLVDLAGRLGPVLTERLVDEGLIARRWTVAQLQECLSRARRNTTGRDFLERLLRQRGGGPNADSVLEANAFRALAPLRPFEVHFAVAIGSRVYVIDVAWPERKMGAEIVGRAHRLASLSAFDRERRKLNALGLDGWRICHLTAAMSPEEMVLAVRAMLAQPNYSHFYPENM
jgi:Transcriptional regulator, AbiEi antitoxin